MFFALGHSITFSRENVASSSCLASPRLTVFTGKISSLARAYLWTGDFANRWSFRFPGDAGLCLLHHKSFIKDVSFAYTKRKQLPHRMEGNTCAKSFSPLCVCVILTNNRVSSRCLFVCPTTSVHPTSGCREELIKLIFLLCAFIHKVFLNLPSLHLSGVKCWLNVHFVLDAVLVPAFMGCAAIVATECLFLCSSSFDLSIPTK